MFIGHKHGYRCADHALEARQSVIRAQEGHLLPPDTVETVEALYEVYNDTWVQRAFIGSIMLASAIVLATLLI